MSSKLSLPISQVETPCSLSRPKSVNIFGFRKSKPTSTVFLPIRLYTDARLIAVKVLPSSGIDEVIRITGAFDSFVKNCILDLSDRKASATGESGSSSTIMFFFSLLCGKCPLMGISVIFFISASSLTLLLKASVTKIHRNGKPMPASRAIR